MYNQNRQNSTPQDNYNPDILKRNRDLVNYALSNTTQVLLIRLDVRYPVDYPAPDDNSIFREFIEDYKRYLSNKGYSPLYLWCKERNTADHCHYHVYFLLDGSKLRYMPHLSQAEKIWCYKLNILFKKGLIHFCNPNGTMLRRNDLETVNNCINNVLDYLAKRYTKSKINGARDWGSSQFRW